VILGVKYISHWGTVHPNNFVQENSDRIVIGIGLRPFHLMYGVNASERYLLGVIILELFILFIVDNVDSLIANF
jgi:hypothetical protein